MRERVGTIARFGLRLLASAESLALDGTKARVLTYHSVTDATNTGPRSAYVRTSDFRQQVEWLIRSGYTIVPLLTLVSKLNSCHQVPAKWVSLTVDDGFEDCYTDVLPILLDLGVTSTLFITTSRVATPGFVTRAQLRELATYGFELGAHSHNHVPLTAIPPSEAYVEVLRSKEDLENIVGKSISCFCYPFGDYNKEVEGYVRNLGFACCCTERAGSISSSTDPLRIPRAGVLGTDSLRDFDLRVRGAYDWWTNTYLRLKGHEIRM